MALLPGPAEYFDLAMFNLVPEEAEFEKAAILEADQLLSLELEMEGHEREALGGYASGYDATVQTSVPIDAASAALVNDLDADPLPTLAGPIAAFAGADTQFLKVLSTVPPETWLGVPDPNPLPPLPTEPGETPPGPGSDLT